MSEPVECIAWFYERSCGKRQAKAPLLVYAFCIRRELGLHAATALFSGGAGVAHTPRAWIE
jgi:hypothetical protein